MLTLIVRGWRVDTVRLHVYIVCQHADTVRQHVESAKVLTLSTNLLTLFANTVTLFASMLSCLPTCWHFSLSWCLYLPTGWQLSTTSVDTANILICLSTCCLCLPACWPYQKVDAVCQHLSTVAGMLAICLFYNVNTRQLVFVNTILKTSVDLV